MSFDDEKVRSLVVKIEPDYQQKNEEGNPEKEFQQGTGFFIAPGYLLTCDHVLRQNYWISGKQKLPAKIILSVLDEKGNLEANKYELKNENWKWDPTKNNIKLLKIGEWPYPDLAILKVPNGNIPFLPMEWGKPGRGAEYPICGFPKGAYKSRTANFDGIDLDKENLELVFKDTDVKEGISGGPIFNIKTGKVCGIINKSRDIEFPHGGYAIPTSEVKKLSESIKGEPDLLKHLGISQINKELVYIPIDEGINVEEIIKDSKPGLFTEKLKTWGKLIEIKPDNFSENYIHCWNEMWKDSTHIVIDPEKKEFFEDVGKVLYKIAAKSAPKKIREIIEHLDNDDIDEIHVALEFSGDHKNLNYLPWEYIKLPNPNDFLFMEEKIILFRKVRI